jgi:hypothetical protein
MASWRWAPLCICTTRYQQEDWPPIGSAQTPVPIPTVVPSSQPAASTVSSMADRTIQTECPRAAGLGLRRRGMAGPPPVGNRRRRGADLVEQPGREIARALVGREAPAGGPEEADAQAGAPWEADEVNRALDRAAHDLCFRYGLRESSEPASGTERPPACPSAFKENAVVTFVQRLQRLNGFCFARQPRRKGSAAVSRSAEVGSPRL